MNSTLQYTQQAFFADTGIYRPSPFEFALTAPIGQMMLTINPYAGVYGLGAAPQSEIKVEIYPEITLVETTVDQEVEAE